MHSAHFLRYGQATRGAANRAPPDDRPPCPEEGRRGVVTGVNVNMVLAIAPICCAGLIQVHITGRMVQGPNVADHGLPCHWSQVGRQKDAGRAPSMGCRGEIEVGPEVANNIETKRRSTWRQRIPMKRPSIASESRESTIDNHRSVYFAMITLPLRQRLETGKPLDFPSKRMRKGGGNENGADSDSDSGRALCSIPLSARPSR